MSTNAPSAVPEGRGILILHLKLRSEDLRDHQTKEPMFMDLLHYSPEMSVPDPYAPDHPFSDTLAPVENASEAQDSCSTDMGVWEDNSRSLPLAPSGPVCWWCCHDFPSDPVWIPIEQSRNVTHGYGHFCSFPCACAYLFREEEMQFCRWERYTMLCDLFQRATGTVRERVPQAPPRQMLKMFGGKLSIEEYRKLSTRDLHYRVLTPTILHATACVQIQETPDYQALLNAVGLPSQSSHPAATNPEGLRLRRTKPLLDPKKTLESYIMGQKSAVKAC